jgi:hypothetical protein
MKNLSKLSIGAVAAGAIAAPSAATTTTVNFNFANNGSGLHDITLGGNATRQFSYLSGQFYFGVDPIANKYSATFGGYNGAVYGELSAVSGQVALPTPNTIFGIGGQFIGFSKSSNGDRYLPLQFDINGTTNVGNAFFNNASDLVKIDYAAVGGVPEPAIWAELVAGFALAGAAMRRRRPQTALTA